jgi:subtilisin-like proprotein convertase family protein
VYSVTVFASTNGIYNLDLISSGHGIADTASNPLTDTDPTGADQTYIVSITVIDTIYPRLESIERYNPASQNTTSQTLIYMATFSENVTGVDASDFILSPDSAGGTGGGSSPVTDVSGSDDVYSVTVFASTNGIYNLDLISSGHGIADTASNPLTDTDPTGADQTYIVSITVIDTIYPRLESIERYNPASQNTTSQTLIYMATFSENVTGVDASDFILSPDSTWGGNTSASTGQFTHTRSPNLAIPYDVTVSDVTVSDFTLSSDSAGGESTSTSTGQFTQTRSPHLTIPDLATVSDTITVSSSGTVASVSVTVDITHTYIGDLKIDIIAPDGTSITLHDNSGGSTVNIDQPYAPLFGSIPISGVWTLQIHDRDAPDPGVLNSWTLTINYSTTTTVSPVTDISGSGDVYYVTVSALQDGIYNLDLVSSGHGITDAAANPLTNTTPTTGIDQTYTVRIIPPDNTVPTLVSIQRSSPAVENTGSQTLVYEVTFSEDVTGVDASDFALSPGSIGGVGSTNTGSSSGQFMQTRSPALAIPDTDTVSDTITVSNSGTATSVYVAVDITHAHIGDLKIDLIAPDGTVQTLHDRLSGPANIDQTYTPDFGSVSIAGNWTLQMHDDISADDGILNSWMLTVNHDSDIATHVTSISGSGDVYYATLSAVQDGTYNLDLVSSGHSITDAAANPLTDTIPTSGTDETYTVSTTVIDTTNPRLVMHQLRGPARHPRARTASR